MAIARVQYSENATAGTATTSFATAWGAGTTSGNYGLCLVALSEDGGRRAVTTPTGWTLLKSKEGGGVHQQVDIFGRELDGTSADTPTIAVDVSTNLVVYLVEYSGVADTPPLDQTGEGVADSTVTTFTVGPTASTLAEEGEVVVGIFGWKNDGTVNTPTSGYTLVDQSEGGATNANASAAWVEKILTTDQTAQTVSVTAALARRFAAAMVTLKATAVAGDTTDPSTPTSLGLDTIADTTATVSWTASTDDTDVAGDLVYNVYVGGVLDGTTTAGTVSYEIAGLTADTGYSITVSAEDTSGNESAQTSALTIRTPATSSGGGEVVYYWDGTAWVE